MEANISLKPYNSFGIEAIAENFATFSNIADALAICKEAKQPIFVLGGGSNILLTKNIVGTVAKNNISSFEIVEETAFNLIAKIGGGYNWHELVKHCTNNGYFGLENLALIPGTCGAAPIQNIGAYGIEIKNFIYKVEFINIETQHLEVLYNGECKFGYRDSIFKNELKNKIIITHIYLMLSKRPTVNLEYAALSTYFEQQKNLNLSPEDILNAVVAIRSSKLPNPEEIGNAGSFFKNPEIDMEAFNVLKYRFPNIVAFLTKTNSMKLAAGWLIEQCGFKGYREGDAGCYEKQALVLVNYKAATGQEIFELSSKIIEAVKEKFNVNLEREVNIL